MRFDVEKLMWEVRHTIEHFYLKALQRSIPKADLAAMENGFQAICQELQSEPTVFTHRDFHSRNIMVASKRLVMIDFQDARLGPPQYDLVSLLRDSYYQLPEDEVTQLIDWYLDEWIKSGGSPFDRKRFLRAFDLMTIQRNFKAIGTFASVWNNRSNIGYLKYIGNTFENIRRAMQRYPEFNRLCEGLTHFYYF
jgi:aminoglycoside/choline kinase family phosphotransferase